MRNNKEKIKYEFIAIEEKPKDWPANAIENQLENISHCFNRFIKNPNYKNKEILISLFNYHDLNQQSNIGLFRTTPYEIAQINNLYLMASLHQLPSLKIYLYELIAKKTRLKKMISWMSKEEDINIPEFNNLLPHLSLFYLFYQTYTIEHNKNFAEYIIEYADAIIEEHNAISCKNFTNLFLPIFNDLSYFNCKKISNIFAFNRDEISKLFQRLSKLLNINKENPSIRPLKGVLMTCISNYILKSRNNYNEGYIYKYINHNIANESIKNHEVWMSIISKLNDERETKNIIEIFDNKEIKEYEWTQNIDLSLTRKYYVCCFSKSKQNKKMEEKYGSCIYGYKNDRIAEIISPITYIKNNEKIPMLSQVITFDVIYDKEEAIKELLFLCQIIDNFNMNATEKKNFLEEILQYWILSVKDSSWKEENERRYVIFMYDEHKYNEIDISNPEQLKIKSTLFLQPDFILNENPVKNILKILSDEKRKSIYSKQYLYCPQCLNIDFDIIVNGKEVKSCPICGNNNISIENKHITK